jgi:hypothetical protein
VNYDDAANELGVSRAEVLRMVIDGKLDVEHHGNDRTVHIDPQQVADRKAGRR